MEEFEIKEGQRLPIETRMELPEFSFEQELTRQPIPFQNRIDSLPDYVTIHPQVAFLNDLSRQFNRSYSAISKDATALGARTVGTDADGYPVFERFTAEVLQDEYEWRQKFKEADEYLTTGALASLLGRSRNWITRNTAALNSYPREMKFRGRQVLAFPSAVASQLRILELQIPPAHHHYSITELQELTGKDHRWIERVFALKNITPEWRENVKTREPAYHYRRDDLFVLEEALAALPAAAGSSLSTQDISSKHNVSRSQLEKVLELLPAVGEKRLNAHSIPMRSFSQEEEAVIVNLIPRRPEGKLYSYDEIATLTNRSYHWVRDAARPFKMDAFKEGSRILLTEEQAATIIDQAKESPQFAGGWLTIEDISRMLLRRRSWVIQRIQSIAVRSEVRLDSRNKPRTHYEPDAIDELQRRYLIEEENEQPQN